MLKLPSCRLSHSSFQFSSARLFACDVFFMSITHSVGLRDDVDRTPVIIAVDHAPVIIDLHLHSDPRRNRRENLIPWKENYVMLFHMISNLLKERAFYLKSRILEEVFRVRINPSKQSHPEHVTLTKHVGPCLWAVPDYTRENPTVT